jgi:pimeloyl-ACP methyl ester carboxylesterase/DNA-binding CsgD family transcriptional regulator
MDTLNRPKDHQAAARFLSAFAARSREGNPLDLIGSDPDGFGAALDTCPQDLAAAFSQDAQSGPIGPAFVFEAAFASAACNEDGRLVIADSAFRGWIVSKAELRAALDRFDPRKPSISFLVEDRGKFIAVAAAPLAHAQHWPLAPEVKACLQEGRAQIAIIARLDGVGTSHNRLTLASRALRLTGLESRVCEGLVRSGDARGAATLASVSYETARDALKSAMKKAGANNQSELVSLYLKLSSGELSSPNTAPVLKDVFGLSPRQIQIALLAASGMGRAAISAVAGVSAHTVKSELGALHAAMGVNSVAGLSRAIGQIQALAALADASSIELIGRADTPEPLRLLPRVNRPGRIAFADHGPISGLPCLMIHTATTGRHMPQAHLRQLQGLGLRPIAFDRPGTGLSDPVDAPYLDQSAQDMVDILDALNLKQACIIARGGSMVMAHFVARFPDRFLRGVSLNPEPRPSQDTTYSGFIGHAKHLLFHHTKLLEGLAMHLAQRSATKTVESLVRRALSSSPADLATLAEPGMMAAYVRSSQQSALQNGAGFVAIAKAEPNEPDCPIKDGRAITILSGAEDPLYNPDDGLARWQAMWPGCTVRIVQNAGRLLQFQRPDLIAQALHQGTKP